MTQSGWVLGASTGNRVFPMTKASLSKSRKRTMKKTLKQRFKDWLFDDQSKDPAEIQIDEAEAVRLSGSKSIRFEIHHANGGRVVQTRRYDEQKDRHFEQLYVITNDQDFGREIDKIITMEALR